MQPLATDNPAFAPLDEPHAAILPRAVYVGSDVFRRAAFGSRHPLNIVRHAAVVDLVKILGWLDSGDFRVASPASVEKLIEFHDRAYVEALQYADSTGRVDSEVRTRCRIGTLENPLFPGLFERAAMTVGGSILAAEIALGGRVAFHPSGGTHHGRRDRASGFCYFNDPVFAIRRLRAGGRERVLYLDLDAHHGDGVEAAFRDVDAVLTVSIHEENRWPYSGAATDRSGTRNLPVPKGFNDSELAYLEEHALLPLQREFAPDALVLCCGADCLTGDPLSGMQLSNVALWDVVARFAAGGRPTVVLGGGGYNPWTVARYWAGLWGVLNGFPVPPRLPAEAESLLGAMECDLVDEEDADESWFTTLADNPHTGPVRDAVRSLADTVTGATA